MMARPSIEIVAAKPADALAVSRFCQTVYAAVYPNRKYGMKPEHFSPEIFENPSTVEYFAGILANSNAQRAYLAKETDLIVGTISIAHLKDFYEIHGFYVALNRQGQGIGKQLMKKALEFCRGDLPVRVEVAENLAKSIAMYERWGFTLAPQYGMNLRHWPEWPDGLQNGYIYLQAGLKDLRL